ncbi:MAG: hypothetical protein U0521_08275 [Anaerolineae bacterium]
MRRVLLQIVERRDLRDDHGQQTQPIRHAQRRAGLGQRQQLEQLVAQTLHRGVEQVRRVGTDVVLRRRIDAETELDALADGAQRANRVVGDGVGVAAPDDLGEGVLRAAGRVDHLAEIAAQVDRQRIDGEIAVAQVGVEAVAAKARHVNRQPTVGRIEQRPPHVALGVEDEERAVRR